jgi:hypothetical protein
MTATATSRAVTASDPDVRDPDVREPVRIRAHHQMVKKLGPWTAARDFDVRASTALVVLDLLMPRIEDGDITIHLDIDHATVKLLVPDDVQIDAGDLRRIGRGRVKDWTGTGTPGGRTIRLLGEMRHGEVRVHRGGVAIVSLVLSGQGREVRQAHRDGRLSAAGQLSAVGQHSAVGQFSAEGQLASTQESR